MMAIIMIIIIKVKENRQIEILKYFHFFYLSARNALQNVSSIQLHFVLNLVCQGDAPVSNTLIPI